MFIICCINNIFNNIYFFNYFFMASLPKEKQIQCKEIFNYYDTDKDGKLSKEEFSDAIKTLGIFIPKEELESTLNKISIYNYESFEELCALKLSQKINKDDIIKAFAFLDPNNKGTCKEEDIKQAFLTLGEPLQENEIDELLNEYKQDGEINYKKLIIALVGK